MKTKQLLQCAGGLVLAGAGIYIFSRDVKAAELWNELRATPAWVIGSVVLLNLLSIWLRALRWKIILPPSPPARRRGLYGIISVGFMVNNILPARLGEAARAFLLWKRNKFSVAESIGSVILERILDTLVFLSFFSIPAFVLPGLRGTSVFAVIMSVCFVLALAGLALYSACPGFVGRKSGILLKWLPGRFRNKAAAAGAELVSNLDWIFSGKKVCAVAALSFLTVFCHAVMMIVVVRDASFGPLGGMFGASCAAIGAAIPLSPGYVGTLHAALKQGLVMVGLGGAAAGATAIIYHAVGYLSITALGVFFFFRMDISLRDIGRARRPAEAEEAGGTAPGIAATGAAIDPIGTVHDQRTASQAVPTKEGI